MTQEPVMDIVNVQLGPSLPAYIIGIAAVIVMLIAVAYLLETGLRLLRKSK